MQYNLLNRAEMKKKCIGKCKLKLNTKAIGSQVPSSFYENETNKERNTLLTLSPETKVSFILLSLILNTLFRIYIDSSNVCLR